MAGVFRRLRAAAAGGALALAVGVASWSPALAACDPAAADGVTATCSGTTNNQGGGAPGTSAGTDGYGTGVENNVTVNVLPGATLTGTDHGIFLNSFINNNAAITNSGSITGTLGNGVLAGTITSFSNSGAITGGDRGIGANIGSLTNSGSITGTAAFGISAGTIGSLTNSGPISGGFAGVISSVVQNLTNSGFITGTDVDSVGFQADFITSLVNSGAITGGDNGTNANTITSLVNSGSITGTFGTGINAATITSLGNSGSITGGQFGIAAGTITSLGNSGSITGLLQGISAGTITSLSNSGSIAGTLNAGIVANTITSLSNSGFIDRISAGTAITRLSNSGSINRISAGTITSLSNSGSIDSIVAGTITSLSNSGSITDTGHAGIEADIITSLSNSGLISGGNFAILEATAANTQLMLLAGSVLVGQVDLGGGVNTLNVGPGLSMVTTFASAPVIGSMSVPFVTSGNQVVTADTTSFANETTMLADLTGGIFSTVENRIDSLHGGTSVAQPLAYAPAAGNPLPDPGAMESDNRIWLQGFGAFRRQAGTSATIGSNQGIGGIAAGIDTALTDAWHAGLFLGGSTAAAVIDAHAGRTAADSFFAGAYSTAQVGRGFVDLAFTAGYSSFDRERRIANNLVPDGIETAMADYPGWFVSPEVRFVQPVGALEGSLTFRYAGLFLDGFSESGVTAGAMTVGSQDIHLGIARAALSLPVTKNYSDGAVARWILTGGVQGRTQFGGDDLTGTLAGQDIAFSAGAKDTIGLFGAWRAELASPLGRTVYAGVEGLAEADGSYQLTGKAGFSVRY